MEQIAILGLGLMGGSLGLALKGRGRAVHVSAYARRAETRAQALAMRCADAVYDDPEEAVRGADLIVYCVPILTIPELVQQSRGGLKPGAILTDVGSTKADLDARMAPLLEGTDAVFVGSHPVAGSEQQGIEAARASLYDGALVVVTPGLSAGAEAGEAVSRGVQKVERFWRELGSLVQVCTAEEHDEWMARTSHLPHLVASLLAVTVGRDQMEQVATFCGTGFRDTTRVADGSPAVWLDIVRTNASAIRNELTAFRDQLDALIDGWEDESLESVKQLLETGRHCRRALMAGSPLD